MRSCGRPPACDHVNEVEVPKTVLDDRRPSPLYYVHACVPEPLVVGTLPVVYGGVEGLDTGEDISDALQGRWGERRVRVDFVTSPEELARRGGVDLANAARAGADCEP